MTHLTNRLWRVLLASVAGAACLLANENISLRNPVALVTEAQAIIGRPLTPLSYAGVARRTTRRAVYGAGAVGYGAAAVGAAGCVRVATAYGLVTRC